MLLGKTASKSVWLFRKLAGPVNVKIGLAPGVNRRSLFEMVGVVLAVQAGKGRPFNRLRALTGVWASMGSALIRMMRAACDNWLNSGGNNLARGLPRRRAGVVDVEFGLRIGQARLRKASAVAIRAVTTLAAASINAWVRTVAVPVGVVGWVDGRMCCGSLRKKVTVMAAVFCRRWSIKCGVRVDETLR